MKAIAKTIDSDMDKAIEKNLDAALVKNKLDKHVSYDVKNGVVTLKGDVISQGDDADGESRYRGAEREAGGE